MNRLHQWYCRSSHWQSTLDRLVPWALEGVTLGDHVLELGPGPGVVTSSLVAKAARVTAIDLDPSANTTVRGDATRLPFPAGIFSAVVAFTMLHHVPSAGLHQQLFQEALRVLRPAGMIAGMDARSSIGLRLFHVGDVFRPLTPDELQSGLTAAGFQNVETGATGRYYRFRASAPA